MLKHASLSNRDTDCQSVPVGGLELDHICAVALGAVDHDAVSPIFGRKAHRHRSFPQSSSSSRFTAGVLHLEPVGRCAVVSLTPWLVRVPPQSAHTLHLHF